MPSARFFSGKNILLRKKATVKSFGAAATKATLPTHVATVGKEGLADTSNQSHGRISCIIGWDEARGRPVYRCTNSFEGPGGYVDENNEFNQVEKVEGKDSPTSLVDNNFLCNEKSRKRKVFGGDRRLRPLTGLLTEVRSKEKDNLPSMNENSSVGCYLDRSSMAGIGSVVSIPSENNGQKAAVADISHTIQSSRQLQTLAEVEAHKSQAEAAKRDDDDIQFEFDDTATTNQATSCKRIKRAANPAPGASASSNDQNSLLHSLDTARKFFEKLAEHRLTLDTSDTPKQLTKRPCCRTRRVRRLSSPNLTGEYKRYVQACRESDVTPLPKQEYAANRGEYFRTNEVYDGFLDE